MTINLSGPNQYITDRRELIPPNQIPGNWIEQKCAEPGCEAIIGYWSLSGKHKDEYHRAKCEKHKKGAKYHA